MFFLLAAAVNFIHSRAAPLGLVEIIFFLLSQSTNKNFTSQFPHKFRESIDTSGCFANQIWALRGKIGWNFHSTRCRVLETLLSASEWNSITSTLAIFSIAKSLDQHNTTLGRRLSNRWNLSISYIWAWRLFLTLKCFTFSPRLHKLGLLLFASLGLFYDQVEYEKEWNRAESSFGEMWMKKEKKVKNFHFIPT